MGKVVKYCNSCEEGFAEKFGFCPNCGAQLQAFEMNPLGNKAAEESKTEPIFEAAAPVVFEAPAETEAPQIAEPQSFSADAEHIEPADTNQGFEFSDDVFEDSIEEPKSFETGPLEEPKSFEAETNSFEAAETASNKNVYDNFYQATYSKTPDDSTKEAIPHY